MEAEFDKYIKIGDKSRTSPNYKNSNIYKLENLLVDRKKYVNESVSFRPVSVNTDKSFIALVSPSLFGKTQTAFTIGRIRPLYFALEYSEFNKQPIYDKFEDLNEALRVAAQKDFKSLKLGFQDPDDKLFTEAEKVFYNLSSKSLETRFREVKLFTLGFLVKLIKDSERDYEGPENGNNSDWMRFHAERDSFSYSAISIKEIYEMDPEFLKKVRTKYYMFLDEFVGHYWAILIRNLARCLLLGAIVANTNSDIANLIGKLHASGSRGGIWDVWSFVVVKLDLTDWEILNNCLCFESNEKLTDKIKVIIEKSNDFKNVVTEELLSKLNISDSQESKFARFFCDFINNVIPKLRPGISFIIADSIMKFDVQVDYNLSKFIDDLINTVKSWVELRKSNMIKNIQGIMGTLALYLSNAYDKNRIKPEIEHRKSYLNDHLYYLNNPANDDEWMFLTFPFVGNSKNLQVHDKVKGKISNETKEWDVETTHFDGDELFTLLMCLFMKSKQSVAYDLEQGYNESIKTGCDTSTTFNPVALKLDGNKFEVLAAVSIIDGSHRQHGSLTASLSGQSGLNFIKKILGNIIETQNYQRDAEISLEFPSSVENSFSLDIFLENCKIPFLYPANLEVPQFLQRLTNEGTVKVGYCERTKDLSKIDFKFSFEYLNSLGPSPAKKIKTSQHLEARLKIEKYFAVAECKNWAKSLKSNELIKILTKSYAQKESFLSLLFCNEVESNLKQYFNAFCLKNEINVYRIVSVSTKNRFYFRVEPFYECKNLELPEMVCIIFETKVINMTIDEEDDEDSEEEHQLL